MMRWIIDAGLRLRLLVVALVIAITAFGAWQVPRAPREILPEFGPVYVEIQTEALGLSATEVEDLITVPLEQNLLNGVAWLDDILSQSIAGLSSIVLIFEPGTDPLRARQMVAERLTQAHMLPHVSKPPTMLQPLSSASRIIMVNLSSTELSQLQTSVIARWTIQPALMGIPGVANVSIWGYRDQQLQVQVDPQVLQAQGIHLEDVIATTGNALWVSPLTFLQASAPGTGGFVDTPNQRLGVQHLLPIGSPDELALVPIEGCTASYGAQDAAGAAACPTLCDVATIVEQHPPLIGDSVAQQQQDILLVIEKFAGADTSAVTDDIRQTLDDLRPGLQGITIDSSLFGREDLIESASQNTGRALLIGLILALAVMALLLFDWRSAAIALVSAPLSLIVAAVILHLRGATFNIVVVAGLIVALVIIIDDVVVDVAHITQRLREHRASGAERPVAAVVADALLEVRSPMVAATAILLLAALPILFLGGLFDAYYLDGRSGTFLQPIVVSYVIAIAASLAVSLIVTPTLAVLLFSRSRWSRQRAPLADAVQRRYGRLMHRFVPVFGAAGAAGLVLLALSLAVLPQLRTPDSIIPASRDRDLLVTWEAIPGTSLGEMDRITSRITGELLQVPGVRNVSAHVGRAITSDQVVDVHAGEIWVSIDAGADYDGTVAAVDAVVQGYPGVAHQTHTYLEQRLASNDAALDDVVVRVYGQDWDVLRSSAAEVQTLMAGVDGVAGTRLDLPVEKPQVQVEVDLAAAEKHGLSPGHVRRTAATLVTGLTVGSLFEQQKVFEVVVVGVPDMRHSLVAIENLLIDTPSGGQVRLGDVAKVTLVPTLDAIQHEAVSRYVDVVAQVSGRSQSAVAEDLTDRLRAHAFPLEYHAEVLGGFTGTEGAERNLLQATLGALIGIYLVLQAIFGSWRLAGLVLVAIPAAMSGGLVALWAWGDAVTIGALLGLLGILAVSVRNIVLLFDDYGKRTRAGAPANPDLVIQITGDRLMPLLATTLGIMLALLPFAIPGRIPGLEILHPMAVVLIGGLPTALLVTLFIVPSLYAQIAVHSAPTPASSSGPATALPTGGVAD